jgi:hypothetical protein
MQRAGDWIGRTIATGIQIPMGGTGTRQLWNMGAIDPILYESHDFGSHILQSAPIQALRASLTELFSDPEFFNQDPRDIKSQVQSAEREASDEGADYVRNKYRLEPAEK